MEPTPSSTGKRLGRRRTILFVSVSAVAGIAVALFLAEMGLRLLGLATVQAVKTVTESQYKQIPGLFAPGQDIVDRSKSSLPYHATINSLGFRGRNLARRKPPGTIRILCLGDSFTFGDFVNDEDTLPAQLERILAEEAGMGETVEVVNGGVGGTTIIDQIELLERGLSLDPDWVVLTFSENDVDDLARGTSMMQALETNRKLKSTGLFGLVYPVLSDTALWHFGLKVKEQIRYRLNPKTPGTEKPSQTELRKKYRKLLARFRETLPSESSRVLFALFPDDFRFGPEDRRDDLLDWAEGVGKAEKLVVVNILPALQASGHAREKLYLLPYDRHPSPLAYRLAAREIAETIVAAPESATKAKRKE